MTKLDELIKEYCPGGVEYKTLGEVCEIKTGAGITRSDSTDDGIYPIISGGVEPLGMYNKSNRKAKTVTIARAGGAGYVNFIDKDFYLNDKCFSIIPVNQFSSKINTRFLYYSLKNQEQNIMSMKSVGSVPTVNTTKVASVQIPVPPLAVQEEIVRILDKFTSLTAELTAELTARRAQYEYYRDALLTPPFSYGYKEHTDSQVAEATTKITSLQNATKSHLFEANLSADRQDGTHDKNVRYSELVSASSFQQGEVQMKKLGEICLQTQNIKWKDEKNEYQYIDLTSVDRENHSITETSTINASNAPSRAQQIVKEDDVLFGTTRPMLKRTAFITKEFNNQICSTGFCVLRADKGSVNPRYIYHQINSSRFYQYVDSHQQGASYPSISDSDVKRFQIPLPPLPVQKRIVDVLDNFDAICSDLKIGLPAEIDARKKQYEYYRDLLLTFAERGNTILTEQNRTEQNRTEQNRTEQNRTEQMR